MLVKSPLRYTAAVVVLIVALMAASSAPVVTTAQPSGSDQCTQVLSAIQKNLTTACSSLNHGEACYGNAPVTAVYQDAASANQAPFAKVGDTVGINLLKSLVTGPLKVDTGEWGVAVLRIQADNLPGTTAGQAVTFVLFGDVTIKDVTGADQAKMPPAVAAACTAKTTRSTYLRNAPGATEQSIQLVGANAPVNAMRRLADGSWVFVEENGKTGWMLSRYVKLDCQLNDLVVDDPSQPIVLSQVRSFYFTTGTASNAACKDVPTGGMLIQSPSGHRVALSINGVEMTIGSSVLFTGGTGNVLDALVLDGHLVITFNGKQYSFFPGQGVLITDPNKSPLHQLMNDMLATLGAGRTYALLNTIVQMMQALSLDVPPDIIGLLNSLGGGGGGNGSANGGNGGGQHPTAPATPLVCTQRTFTSDGKVCIPNWGLYDCNRNGVCDNGEMSYTCPEDCGAPPPPDGWGGPSSKGTANPTQKPTEFCPLGCG